MSPGEIGRKIGPWAGAGAADAGAGATGATGAAGTGVANTAGAVEGAGAGVGGGGEATAGAAGAGGAEAGAGPWARACTTSWGSPPKRLISARALLSLSLSIRSDVQLGRWPLPFTGPCWFQKSLARVRSAWSGHWL